MTRLSLVIGTTYNEQVNLLHFLSSSDWLLVVVGRCVIIVAVLDTVFCVHIWVCLKMGYTPNYSHLVGIMIINHWV